MTIMADLVAALPSVSVALAVSLSLYVCYDIFSTYWRLRDIPGPFLAKFTDFQRMFWVKTMRAQEIHLEAHEKYGDCVRFGPNTVSLSDPAMIPILYPMRRGFPKVFPCNLHSEPRNEADGISEFVLQRNYALRKRWRLSRSFHHSRRADAQDPKNTRGIPLLPE